MFFVIRGVLDATKAAFCAVCPEEDGGSWMKKCISFGADGASVNMGHRGGVIAHLQREAGRHIIPIHCMPHRFVNNENKFSMIYLYLLVENVKQCLYCIIAQFILGL